MFLDPRTVLTSVLLAVIGGAGCAPSSDERPAELVLTGGRIVTMDADFPEVTALAARDGRIIAVGDDATTLALAGPDTTVVDLEGRFATPGFIDAHGHFLGLGLKSLQLDLTTATTWSAVVDRVRREAAKLEPGTWIVGRGWHQEKWEEPPGTTVAGFPTREALDRAAPEHPAFLVHASGHAAIVNAAALAAAGIDDRTPDPPGGRIVRDANGRTTGVLHETAEGLVSDALERSRGERDAASVREERERIVAAAARACIEHGVTSFQDAGSTLDDVELFDDLAAAGRLPVRLWVMLGESDADIAVHLDGVRRVGAHGGFLTVRAIKRYADGALGNRGAWLIEPYADAPGTTGIPVTTIESLEDSARLARDHDFQLCVHAIGDRANREVLDLYERTFTDGGLTARRWRIEHAQHVDPADLPRFAALGVIASMQGVHCTSDGPWVPQRIGGERAAAGAYAWRSLIDAGARLANGTDTPVEPVDPIASFAALVTRRMGDGSRFHPEQSLTRAEALAACTVDAAHAAFEEDVKGSLTPGKYADVVVLTQDLLRAPDDALPDTRVWMTVVGGRIVYGGPDRDEEGDGGV